MSSKGISSIMWDFIDFKIKLEATLPQQAWFMDFKHGLEKFSSQLFGQTVVWWTLLKECVRSKILIYHDPGPLRQFKQMGRCIDLSFSIHPPVPTALNFWGPHLRRCSSSPTPSTSRLAGGEKSQSLFGGSCSSRRKCVRGSLCSLENWPRAGWFLGTAALQ